MSHYAPINGGERREVRRFPRSLSRVYTRRDRLITKRTERDRVVCVETDTLFFFSLFFLAIFVNAKEREKGEKEED